MNEPLRSFLQNITANKQKLAMLGYFKFRHRSGTCPELGKLPDAVLTKQFSCLLHPKVYDGEVSVITTADLKILMNFVLIY